MSVRRFRFSGFPRANDPFHYVLRKSRLDPTHQAVEEGRLPSPKFVRLKDGTQVPQWKPTVKSRVSGFNPAGDCNGYFMSYQFQPNNNCYNYACNVATNSFAHPGRKHGTSLFSPTRRLTGDSVVAAARADGLIEVGRSEMGLSDVLKVLNIRRRNGLLRDGHLVALLISVADSKIRWRGDFHFVRCDAPDGKHWSQKNGPDQVTDFDFAGNLIKDPSTANWVVNQGLEHHRRPTPKAPRSEIRILYRFEAWMFVPFGRVSII